jgi:hypothetical protein
MTNVKKAARHAVRLALAAATHKHMWVSAGFGTIHVLAGELARQTGSTFSAALHFIQTEGDKLARRAGWSEDALDYRVVEQGDLFHHALLMAWNPEFDPTKEMGWGETEIESLGTSPKAIARHAARIA